MALKPWRAVDGRGAEAVEELWTAVALKPTGRKCGRQEGLLHSGRGAWSWCHTPGGQAHSGHIHEGQVPGPSPEKLDTHTDPRMLESKTYSLEQRPTPCRCPSSLHSPASRKGRPRNLRRHLPHIPHARPLQGRTAALPPGSTCQRGLFPGGDSEPRV